jgi:steroid delta-isomerase-like uncharacterized protein
MFMASQENINLVKRFFEEIYNKGNFNLMDELLSSNVTIYDQALPNHREGLREYKNSQNQYKQAFPNRKGKIEDVFASDDKVAVRWSLQATHKGDLKDLSATNKDFKVTGISLYSVKSGKITEIFHQWDRLGLLEQIGEIQPAAALH